MSGSRSRRNWIGSGGTGLLDEAARKGVIRRRIDRWREAVELQHERLTKAGDRQMADLHFHVVAVDNLVGAVRVVHVQYPQFAAVGAAVQDAPDRYTEAPPDVSTCAV